MKFKDKLTLQKNNNAESTVSNNFCSKNVTAIAVALNTYWVGRYSPISSNAEKNVNMLKLSFVAFYQPAPQPVLLLKLRSSRENRGDLSSRM